MADDIEEMIKTAQGLKATGNDFFKKNDFQKALASYTKIFLYTNHLDKDKGMTESQSQQIKELRIAAYLNCATCFLKQSKYDKALSQIELLLNVEKDYPKAIFRRGQIYLAKGELDLAKKDLRAAAKTFPKDATLKQDLQTLAKKGVEAVEKQKKTMNKFAYKLQKENIKLAQEEEEKEIQEEKKKKKKKRKRKEKWVLKKKIKKKKRQNLSKDRLMIQCGEN